MSPSPGLLHRIRQLLRKVLDRERFVFYPKAEGEERWYEVGVTPTLDRFFGALPMLKKAVASPRGTARVVSVLLRRAA